LGHININRAIRKKKDQITTVLVSEGLDVLFVTEAGVRQDEPLPDIEGFKTFMVGRRQGEREGGGIVGYVRQGLKCIRVENTDVIENQKLGAEILWSQIRGGSQQQEYIYNKGSTKILLSGIERS
jgi:hypothetical protein